MALLDSIFPSRAALGRLAEVSKEAARKWAEVPADRCALVERNSGGKYRCEDLRPDLRWQRDPATGAVLGYFVNVTASASAEADTQEAA